MNVDPGSDLVTCTMRFSMSDDIGAFGALVAEYATDVSELSAAPEVTKARINQTSVGVGFSGPGFELALDIARTVLDDIDRLAALGGWLLWFKDRVARRRNRNMPFISDGNSLGAVAAALVGAPQLVGARFENCVPLTGWPDFPQETDERFVWAAAFEYQHRHEVLVVFMSPAGVELGRIFVPQHAYMDQTGLTYRTPQELATVFKQSNRNI